MRTEHNKQRLAETNRWSPQNEPRDNQLVDMRKATACQGLFFKVREQNPTTQLAQRDTYRGFVSQVGIDTESRVFVVRSARGSTDKSV